MSVASVLRIGVVLLVFVGQAAAAEKITGKLSVKDVLTKPKEEVVLEARLVEQGLLRESGLGGEVLQFSVGGVEVGTAMTGGDGRAFTRFTPRMRGNLVIRVTFPGSKRVKGTEATGLLASWERRRPIILVELEALLKEPSAPVTLIPGVKLPVASGGLTAPASEAAPQLERLARYYFNVLYVARSTGLELESFRSWLKEHDFPSGFPTVIQPGQKALGTMIEDLQERGFDNITGGVGRSQDFAETLASRRMKVVILSESGKERAYPTKTRWAKDWLEVRQELQG